MAVAYRHKCAGFLFAALCRFSLFDRVPESTARALREYGRLATVRSMYLCEQLTEAVKALSGARIEFVLLKGAARLYAGASDAYWHWYDDIDILIERRDGDRAVAALRQAGYSTVHRAGEALLYERTHHHLAPLVKPGGVSVELHLALAPPQKFSLATDWDGLTRYFCRLSGPAGEVLTLDAAGTALHRALHGAGIAYLHDVVLLAQMLSEHPQLANALRDVLRSDRRRAVALKATLLLAAQMAGVPLDADDRTRAALRWAMRRENLPLWCAKRSQFIDAWLLGQRGRVFLGDALPHNGVWARSLDRCLWPLRLCGRLAVAAALLSIAADRRPAIDSLRSGDELN